MNKPIKVLHVIPELSPSGISAVVMNWVREIDLEKVQFDFVSFNDGEHRNELEVRGCQVFCIPTLKQSPIKHIKAIQNIFTRKDGGYDVIHVHNSFKNFVMLGMAKKQGIPVRVCHSHTSGLESTWLTPIFSIIKSLTKKFSNHYVACGEKAGEFLFGDDKFLVLNNAIKVDGFLPTPEKSENIDAVLKKYNLPKHKQLVLHVGRFVEVKNHSFLLKLATDESLQDNIHFVCVGDGPLKEKFTQDIKNLGQTHRFSLLPANNDIPLILNASTAFIMPSLFEGVSVALLEAQAAKLHCLVSDTISVEADMGLSLVEFLSLEKSDDWIEKLNNLNICTLEDDTVKKAFANKNYSIEAVTHQLINLYKSSLKAQ